MEKAEVAWKWRETDKTNKENSLPNGLRWPSGIPVTVWTFTGGNCTSVFRSLTKLVLHVVPRISDITVINRKTKFALTSIFRIIYELKLLCKWIFIAAVVDVLFLFRIQQTVGRWKKLQGSNRMIWRTPWHNIILCDGQNSNGLTVIYKYPLPDLAENNTQNKLKSYSTNAHIA